MRRNHCSSARCSTGCRFVAPAAAVDHLFVRENRGAERTPVHQGLFAIGEAALHHAQEEPLIPAVVFRIAGGDFAVPVVGKGEAPVGALHLFDVGEGPVARRPIVLDGGVFGGEPERVPTHGMQHVEAAHPHMAGERVADRVVADVANVKSAARVRQHLKHVIFGLARSSPRLYKGTRLPISRATSTRSDCGRRSSRAFTSLETSFAESLSGCGNWGFSSRR